MIKNLNQWVKLLISNYVKTISEFIHIHIYSTGPKKSMLQD